MKLQPYSSQFDIPECVSKMFLKHERASVGGQILLLTFMQIRNKQLSTLENTNITTISEQLHDFYILVYSK